MLAIRMFQRLNNFVCKNFSIMISFGLDFSMNKIIFLSNLIFFISCSWFLSHKPFSVPSLVISYTYWAVIKTCFDMRNQILPSQYTHWCKWANKISLLKWKEISKILIVLLIFWFWRVIHCIDISIISLRRLTLGFIDWW